MKLKVILLVFICTFSFSQTTKNVLFLGNSYTGVNNLPSLIKSVANSTNDDIIFDSNTPGGYTLQGHSSNTTSLNKIMQGNCDFVVLQEQSQLPSFTLATVQTQVFPFATQLNNVIEQYNPCAETIFYLTWGRKNGDSSNCASWPPVCTYEGMDDLLLERYTTMTTDNEAIMAPAGAVWRYLRTSNPEIELYTSDNSHPSLAGSYAAAVTFYTTIFRKDPTLISFNSSLSVTDANNIKQAVKTVVFNNLNNWFIGNYDTISGFTFSENSNTFSFTNTSQNATTYAWDFGDGNTSSEENPTHIFTSTGNFTVTLTVTKCGISNQSSQNISITNLGLPNETSSKIIFYPNPIQDVLIIENANIKNIRLFDVLGNKIEMKIRKEDSKINIDCSTLAKGFYYLQLENANGSFTKKIVKN
ncbi:T9SS type A sorting domain-containing protein [Flavobacterium sp. LMO8]|uniref:PKD domain-containing protein n=1 Tax=Flavobacterium sp. LMO8 TaxID=2654244 RepID=UPI00129149A2|nr:PKD domain-containing protein [Flavobacterium sp. LMO8]MQP24108.1 T9SS type A sorting domain-containing protein [Flavobacterium sp. LMO8]